MAAKSQLSSGVLDSRGPAMFRMFARGPSSRDSQRFREIKRAEKTTRFFPRGGVLRADFRGISRNGTVIGRSGSGFLRVYH